MFVVLRELRELRVLRAVAVGACSVTACIVTLTISVAAQTPATPQDRGRAESAKRRVTDRLRALQQEADALASQEKTILVELRALEVQRQIKIEELTRIDREMRQNRQKLTETTARASELRKTAETQRPDAEARLVHLYKLGRAGYWRLLLDVDDVRSMGRAYRTASALTRIDRDRIQQHQRTLESLAREKKELEARAKEIARLQADATKARVAIDRTVSARSALVDSIDAQRDLNAQLIGELQAAQQRLQSSVAQLDSGPAAVPLPLGAFRGALPWPVRGPIASRFGRQTGGRFGPGVSRNGVEILVPEGQVVRAVHEGTVAYADQFTGYGNLVIVDHGERAYSLYGYLGDLQVSQGDRIDAQAQLGSSGLDPEGTAALYFELRVDGKAVDPLQWLKRP